MTDPTTSGFVTVTVEQIEELEERLKLYEQMQRL